MILRNADCLDVMKEIPDRSINLILCDLPYGKTQNSWDCVIPLPEIWESFKRIVKTDGAIVLTSVEPFTAMLVMSNLEMFRYDLQWEKTTPTGHLNAKKMPLRAHETILVFGWKTPKYFPIKTTGHVRKTARNVDRRKSKIGCYGKESSITSYDSTERYPRSVIKFSTDKQRISLHPTQKPVALMEYLIKTFTQPTDLVLDCCMGSGTTGVACRNTGRNFFGIEKDENYFRIAERRILHDRL